MKELSIEGKATRYDQVIEQLRGLLEGIHEEKCDIMEEDIIKIFPELKESEGEKIRKWLICTLKSLNNSPVQIDGAYEMMLPAIAWLEKQGEKDKEILILKDKIESLHAAIKALKEVHKIELEKQGEQPKKHDVCDCCDQQGSCVSPCPMKLVEKQGEQKSSWSKEDEEKMLSIFLGIETFCPSIIYGNDKEELLNWFKDLKERVGCEVNCTTTWKPSDEQMETLKYASGGNYVNLGVLESLYQDLKKLKEEKL